MHSWEVYSIPYPKLRADFHHIPIAFIFGGFKLVRERQFDPKKMMQSVKHTTALFEDHEPSLSVWAVRLCVCATRLWWHLQLITDNHRRQQNITAEIWNLIKHHTAPHWWQLDETYRSSVQTTEYRGANLIKSMPLLCVHIWTHKSGIDSKQRKRCECFIVHHSFSLTVLSVDSAHESISS